MLLFPVISSDAKRKRATAESCAKKMAGNLLSLKISICKVLVHVLKMTWFLGSLNVLRKNERMCVANLSLATVYSTKQIIKHMHKYGS